MCSSTASTPAARPRAHRLWHRWPSALGLAVAALMVCVGKTDREAIVVVVCVAVFGYLAAAALERPWMGWAAIGLSGALVPACELLGVRPWVGFAVASAALVVVGVLGGVSRAALGAQTGAALVYGGVAVFALGLGPRVGGILVSAALIGHAAWDVIHHRRNDVVPRSLSEGCIFLDVPLGLAALLLTLLGTA